MRRTRCTLSLLLAYVALAPLPVLAADDEFYYQLGGGVPISPPPSNRLSTLRVGGSVAWDADLTCGNFDISTSVSNQLNGLSGAFQNLMGNVVDNARGVVASLPALIIQRLNPALYDLLQNGVLQASEEFHLAELSCEAIVDRAGRTLERDGWRGLAEAGWWRQESQSPNRDILKTKDEAETEGPDQGVPWVAGRPAGGRGQEPIRLHEDTLIAGYNHLLGRSADNRNVAATVACGSSLICKTWPEPELAAEWLTDVLGEIEIATCSGCNGLIARSGLGLQRKTDLERQRIAATLTPLVGGSLAINAGTLDIVQGAEGLQVTRRVIEAIREEEYPHQVIQRLAAELATSRTLEQALMARRALLAGMKEPNIANNEEALKRLYRSIDELEGELDTLVYELEVRKLLSSNTTLRLLQRHHLRRWAPVVEPVPANTLREGAVKR